MDLKAEAKSEMEPYMGLQRKVPECWKLETRRLASLCEKSDAERETLCWILCGYEGLLCFAYQHWHPTKGAFGCATLLDKSLPIEEGDARYMPSEILNEKHDDLDKADIFSLGVAMYELIRGSPLPEEGPQTLNLKKGKLPLLPGHSLQLQNLLKAMLDPNPVCRPSAKELVENLMFHRVLKNAWA